jgi:uncharacterized membrane protein YoaK (UPF0700 family)|tara:strand:+ start:83 stop:337 length:255 start_codon:yes stop_codon:yes gene_type:complete
MLTNLSYILLLVAGFFVGIILSRLCKDEIKKWRKRLFIMSVISFVLVIIVSFIPFGTYKYKIPTIITLFFIIIVNLTISWKSHD